LINKININDELIIEKNNANNLLRKEINEFDLSINKYKDEQNEYLLKIKKLKY
jgi:hypothetical protein